MRFHDLYSSKNLHIDTDHEFMWRITVFDEHTCHWHDEIMLTEKQWKELVNYIKNSENVNL